LFPLVTFRVVSDASSEMVRQLIAELGDAGIQEMRRDPGLAAAVDQHSAAVRDVLTASGDQPASQVLIDYVEGFVDAAIERGWWPDDGRYDWETIRVVAVYTLIQESS
jgi:hypothetical protein